MAITVNPDIGSFSALTDQWSKPIMVGGAPYYVENANVNGNAPWAISEPNDHTLQFNLRPGDLWPDNTSARTEIGGATLYAPTSTVNISYQVTVQPGLADYNLSWEILGQIHSDDNSSITQSLTQDSPVFSFHLTGADGVGGGDYLAVEGMYALSGQTTPTAAAPAGNPYNGYLYVSPEPIVRGKSYSIQVEGSFQNNSNGYVEVWVNGTQVVNYHGPIGYGASNYWKEGVYEGWTTTQPITVDYANTTVTSSAYTADNNTTVAGAPVSAPVFVSYTANANGSFTINGTAAPNTTVHEIQQVFATGGDTLKLDGTATVNASGNWTYTTPSLINGTWDGFTAYDENSVGDVSATTTNNGGGVTTKMLPSPVIQSTDVNGDAVTLSGVIPVAYGGTGPTGATVLVYDGATELGSTTTTAGGLWSFTTSSLANGAHSFTAELQNSYGNSAPSIPIPLTLGSSADPAIAEADPAAAPTISGAVAGQATTSEAAVKPFSAVTIADPNSGASDTLTITVGGAGGALSGTGLTGGTGGVYTLTGTAATVTSELDALSFKPTAGAPGTNSTTTFKLSDLSSAYATATVNMTTSVVEADPAAAPTISGTVAGQATTSEAAVKPFSAVKVTDPNSGASDTLTITVGGAGGALSGTGLTGGTGGVYTLTGTAASVTSELDALSFTPKAGAPGTSSTTTFKLSDLSSADATATVNTTTSVVDTDPAVTPAAPTISGAVAGQATTSEAAVKPFSAVKVTDPNSGASDTLTITVAGAGGALSGTGLTGGTGGVYTLTGTAATVTSELDALSFAATAGAPGTSSTTTFKLSDLSSAYATATVNTTTSVVDTDPAGGALAAPVILSASPDSGPSSALTTTSNQLTLVGTAAAGATITVFDSSTDLGTATTNASGVWTFTTPSPLTDGAHSFTATATNASGAQSAHSAALAITVNPDIGSFSALTDQWSNPITIDGAPFYVENANVDGNAPSAISETNPQTLRFVLQPGATWSDNDSHRTEVGGGTIYAPTTTINTSYQFMVEPGQTNQYWTVLGQFHSDDSSPITQSLTTDYPDFAVELTGPNGHGQGDYLAIWADYALPGQTTPTAITPTGGASWGFDYISPTPIVRGQNYSMQIEASFQNNAKGFLEVWINGAQVVDYHGPLGYGAGTYWKEGIYQDPADTTQTLAVDYKNLTVSATPSAPLILGHKVSGNQVTVTGTAEANGTVTVYDGSTKLGTTTVAGNGTWSYQSGALPVGPFTLTATVTDSAGNVSAVSNAVDPTIAPVAPTISGAASGKPALPDPFAGVSVADANANATDTLTITVGGAGGALNGAGLSGGTGGVYTLSGMAATITSELDALAFTQKSGSTGASKTTFTLSDLSSAYATPTVNTVSELFSSSRCRGRRGLR